VIAVDSSVWIANLRGVSNTATQNLRTLIDGDDDQLLIGDLVLLEVLQGARNETHASLIERGMRQYPIVPMLSDLIAVRAAQHYRNLRANGFTVRKTVDMIIVTFCLVEGHSLLHNDRDFDPMERLLGLKIIK
jgi:predicted nucleic acid-binding protein